MARRNPIEEVAPDLYLIALDQNIPGFTSFIGSWLYKGTHTLLVDVGPTATVPILWDALDRLDVTHLDAVLLTHIHIDHAGGTADFLRRFPDTPVVCHGTAVPHLRDPYRLWEGSHKTLGDTAKAYGPIEAVPEKNLSDAASFKEFGVAPILTPGHAPHHVSYLIDPYLFGGEAGGVFTRLSGGGFRLRPATPPKFFLETSVKSLDVLMTVPHTLFCYGHFGATRHSPENLRRHKEQLFEWQDIISTEMQHDPGPGIEDRCMAALLQQDHLLDGRHPLPADIQARERTFFRNSIRGFIGYLEAKTKNKKH